MLVFGPCGLASIPYHPQWSCSLQYAYASVCWFHAFGRCCMFPKSLLMTFPFFLPLQFIFKNFASILQKLYFLNRYKFLIRALSPLLNDTLHHRYIVGALKIIIYDSIICFLFTKIRNVCNTKRNLIFVWKLVKIVLEDDFCMCIIVILVIFENLCFTC